MNKIRNKSSITRDNLSKLLRESGELITVDKAASILQVENDTAAKALARWKNQGWFTRVKRGLYLAVPVEASNSKNVIEDAWLLVPELFSPAYVGGWSAAEYWDLTEQIFRDICVFTGRPVSKRKQVIYNVFFEVKHIAASSQFGTKPVWKKGKKILVSDPTKTIIDMLSDPTVGGGIQHTIDCFTQYIKSKNFKENQLIDYAKKLDNGAVFKRLGFLSSQLLGDEHLLTIECSKHLTKGNAQLDPNFKGNKLITRWHLFIPANLKINGERE